jgi:SEC-C motif
MNREERGRVLYIRPSVAGDEDLGLHYRDVTNRTGRCPGCDVDVTHRKDGRILRVLYFHDGDCPVLTTTARPDYSKPSHMTVAKPGRNAPCPCGSGRKWKFCHMRRETA